MHKEIGKLNISVKKSIIFVLGALIWNRSMSFGILIRLGIVDIRISWKK